MKTVLVSGALMSPTEPTSIIVMPYMEKVLSWRPLEAAGGRAADLFNLVGIPGGVVLELARARDHD